MILQPPEQDSSGGPGAAPAVCLRRLARHPSLDRRRVLPTHRPRSLCMQSGAPGPQKDPGKRLLSDFLSTVNGKEFQPQDVVASHEEMVAGAVEALTSGTPSLGGLGPSRGAGCRPSPRASPGTSLQPHSSAWSQGQACAEHLEPHLRRGSRRRPEPPPAQWAPAMVSLSPAPQPAFQSSVVVVEGSLWAKRQFRPAPVGGNSLPFLSRPGCSMPPLPPIGSPQAGLGPWHEHRGQACVPAAPSTRASRAGGAGAGWHTSVCQAPSGPPLSLPFQPRLPASPSSEPSGVEERAWAGRGGGSWRETGAWSPELAAPSDSLLGSSQEGLGRPSEVPGLPPFPRGPELETRLHCWA